MEGNDQGWVTGVTVISGVIRDMKCNHFRCSIIQFVVD